MIKLIVGLGNPGRQYEKNRHNAGFLFLDQLLGECAGSWAKEARFHGVAAKCCVGGNKVFLLKPQTFMNRSGLSVGSMVRYYKFKTEEVLIVHDELDLGVGVAKLKKGGGHAGHNGLRDIMANLGEKSFYRIRIGVGRPASGRPVVDYVLSNPSKEEFRLMLSAFDLVGLQKLKIISGDMAGAMNALNKASV